MKQQRIVELLRNRIVEGRWSPQTRLPTWRQLSDEFIVSLMTVKAALDQLAREGFVESRGTAGTYVSSRPPHLHRIALVFDVLPDSRDFSRFLMSLSREAQAAGVRRDRDVSIWYGIDGHADNEDFQQLVSDIRRRRLAGLFLVAPMSPRLTDSPLMDDPRLPRVRVGTAMPEHGIRGVILDSRSFFEKALDHFVARGRRRVAIIEGLSGARRQAELEEALRRRGMICRPYWWHRVGISDPKNAANVTHLLMRLSPDDRPDAVLITDDNAVEYATAGLVAAGVRVPHELDVVAHCNFPWPTPSVVPVRRLGYDTRQVLQAGLDLLDAERQGQPLQELRIDAIWEEELEQT